MLHVQSLTILGPEAHGSSDSTCLGAARCRRKFLHSFPDGFRDETYLAWERNYKWLAHRRWAELLNQEALGRLLDQREYAEIAKRAMQVESRTNLLFSFEKMAFRDAVRSAAGARSFAMGLYDFLYAKDSQPQKFGRWIDVLAGLPRKKTRVLTWPLATVFGFLAYPSRHIFLKPRVMQIAARSYGFALQYQSRPEWGPYASFLSLARAVRTDLSDLNPRDMIDIQSFLWVQGSDEYA